jgi:hypothetical protein
LGEIDINLEKLLTTGYEQPSMWQTFVKDIAPELHDAEAQMAILNHFNERGWELVNVQGRFAYFKRVNPEWVKEQEEAEKRHLAMRARR